MYRGNELQNQRFKTESRGFILDLVLNFTSFLFLQGPDFPLPDPRREANTAVHLCVSLPVLCLQRLLAEQVPEPVRRVH